MAKFVPHPQLAKKLGLETLDTPARSIRELLDEIHRRAGAEAHQQATMATILVNGRNMAYLQGLDTALGPDDQVWTVLPSGGG